ncbi:LysR family transcriptional regulator [Pseudogracilibacillus sp. SE30717A]|uniref:LysR family transcriptional regulator n=1 Tax=Pseudogracilibacillus sp. SE30717A TaxID=3098293 RepID=UPI00300DF157
MDIRHLEYFLEVAKHLNFTKAAAALHISQPTLSKTIKGMEEELGVPLFDRSFRQLALTDAGKALQQNAKNVIHAYENLTSEMDDVFSLKKGEIRIGIPPIIGAAFCSNLISQYIDTYPHIKVSLIEVGSKKIKHGIMEGSLDIGFVCSNPLNKRNVESIELIKDPLMVLVSNDHSLCESNSVHITDLEKEAFIMYRQDFSLYDSILDTCTGAGFYPNIVCESSQKDFILEMVEAKLGIALLPARICGQIKETHIKAIPFKHPEIHLELGMIWKRNEHIPFSVREFIAIAKNSILKE